MNDTTIRAVRRTDALEIARLAAELGYPTPPEEMGRRVATVLENPNHHIVVAGYDTGRLRGWVHIEHRVSLESGDRAELMGLVVDATDRRGGLGRSLVRIAEEWASARGLFTMTVRSNIAREASHPFYEVLGYSRSKTQHVYTKALSAPETLG